MSEEDKLLLEECARLGDDLIFAELNDWKKNLKSNKEDLSNRSTDANSNINISNSNETCGKNKMTKKQSQNHHAIDFRILFHICCH